VQLKEEDTQEEQHSTTSRENERKRIREWRESRIRLRSIGNVSQLISN